MDARYFNAGKVDDARNDIVIDFDLTQGVCVGTNCGDCVAGGLCPQAGLESRDQWCLRPSRQCSRAGIRRPDDRLRLLASGVCASGTGCYRHRAGAVDCLVPGVGHGPQRGYGPGTGPRAWVYKRVFLVLVVTMACNGFVYAGMMYTVPKVFEIGLAEARPDSYTGIGILTGAVIGLSSVCSYVGGWLAERYSPRWVYLVFWALLIPALVVVTLVSGFGLIFSMLLAMSFLVTFAAAENMLVARYTPFQWRSVAYGARFVLALGIGGVTVYLAGDLYDQSGNFDQLFLMFAGSAVIAVIGALLLPVTGRSNQAPLTAP